MGSGKFSEGFPEAVIERRAPKDDEEFARQESEGGLRGKKKKSKSQAIGTLCRILIDHILPFLQNLCVKRDTWGQLHKRGKIPKAEGSTGGEVDGLALE